MTEERGKHNKTRKQKFDAVLAALAELAADHSVLNANDEFLSSEHGDLLIVLQGAFGILQQMSAQLITIQTTLDNVLNQQIGEL